MKIDRLIGVLSVLLQKREMTASELAEKFEVSRRTILRDIDDLCRAGIPIATRQGGGGGISIMENYRVERILTSTEMRDILAGLRSLDSVNGTNRYEQLMEKLCPGSSDFMTGDQFVLIDLSSWYREPLTLKIEQIRTAIAKNLIIEFFYYGPGGEGERKIEPYYLIFRWSSWYVWGFCPMRKDFRLFKLNRMERLTISKIDFEKRAVTFPDLSDRKIFPGKIKVKALFEPGCKWRLVEEFGEDSFCVQTDGRLLFHADYTNKENLIAWLMGFLDGVEILEPVSLREEIREILLNMQKKYGEVKNEISMD